MKNLMKLSVVLVAAALAFSSCNCFKKMAKNRDDIKLTVTPDPDAEQRHGCRRHQCNLPR